MSTFEQPRREQTRRYTYDYLMATDVISEKAKLILRRLTRNGRNADDICLRLIVKMDKRDNLWTLYDDNGYLLNSRHPTDDDENAEYREFSLLLNTLFDETN